MAIVAKSIPCRAVDRAGEPKNIGPQSAPLARKFLTTGCSPDVAIRRAVVALGARGAGDVEDAKHGRSTTTPWLGDSRTPNARPRPMLGRAPIGI